MTLLVLLQPLKQNPATRLFTASTLDELVCRSHVSRNGVIQLVKSKGTVSAIPFPILEDDQGQSVTTLCLGCLGSLCTVDKHKDEQSYC